MAVSHPLWDNVILAMHMDGSNASTTFTDLKGHSISAAGNAQISTAQSKFGGASALFDGTGDYLTTGSSDSWLIGTKDFHLSCWVWIAAASAPDGLGNRYADLVSIDDGGSVTFNLEIRGNGSTTGTGMQIYSDANGSGGVYFSISNGAWHFVEVDRFKGTLYLSLDGVLQGSVSYPGSLGSTSQGLHVGGRSFSTNYAHCLNGYIDDLIFIRGAALNVNSFTPPSAPFTEGWGADLRGIEGAAKLLGSAIPAWFAQRLELSGRCRDLEHDGSGRIVGTTSNEGSPNYRVSRRVRLFRKRDGLLAREGWSDAGGNYAFNSIRQDVDYVVVSHDHTGLYNAVIADSITPEAMP